MRLRSMIAIATFSSLCTLLTGCAGDVEDTGAEEEVAPVVDDQGVDLQRVQKVDSFSIKQTVPR